MKQLVNLLPSILKRENPSTIISIFEEKKYPFIVLISEVNKEKLFFLKQVIKNLNLVEGIGHKKLKNTKAGDIIIFGDTNIYKDYDYRIISSKNEYEEVDNLDDRKFKVYDLISDFKSILKRVYQYADANYQQSSYDDYIDYHSHFTPVKSYVRRKPKKKRSSTYRFKLNVTKNNARIKKRYMNQIELPPLVNNNYQGDKVDINHNWVRIGWNQYDIDYDTLTGDETITLGNGDTLLVEEDRYGRKYLSR